MPAVCWVIYNWSTALKTAVALFSKRKSCKHKTRQNECTYCIMKLSCRTIFFFFHLHKWKEIPSYPTDTLKVKKLSRKMKITSMARSVTTLMRIMTIWFLSRIQVTVVSLIAIAFASGGRLVVAGVAGDLCPARINLITLIGYSDFIYQRNTVARITWKIQECKKNIYNSGNLRWWSSSRKNINASVMKLKNEVITSR